MDQDYNVFSETSGLAVREAARYLGLSESYLNKLRSEGGGPKYSKLGSRVTYTQKNLDAYRDAKTFASISEYHTPVEAA